MDDGLGKYMVKYNNEALTSVVITCHNYGSYLEECINSVINQTINVKEIIVVNDGSTDDSEKIAKSFENKIRYFAVHFLNAQKTRNFGLEKSSGKYIIFLDADDYFEKNCIERMQIEMEKNESLYLVYSDRYNIGNKEIIDKYDFEEISRTREYDYDVLQYFNYISLPSLIRKEMFIGFDEKIKRFQDWDVWLTFLEGDREAKRIPEPLFSVRFHGLNLTIKTNFWRGLYVLYAKRNPFYKIPFLIIRSIIISRKLN